MDVSVVLRLIFARRMGHILIVCCVTGGL